MPKLILSLFGTLFTLVCLGCTPSGPEIAHVSGRITMDGKPLPNATVVFIPENGRPAGARTDDSGHYVLNFTEGRQGAMPGPNAVRISTARDPEQDENGKFVTPAAKEIVPMEYNAATKLAFTIEPKKNNVANFDLKSGGKLPPSD